MTESATADKRQTPEDVLRSGLAARAKDAGLDMSTMTEREVRCALAKRFRLQFKTELEKAGRAHDRYLAEYGSLADALEDEADAAE